MCTTDTEELIKHANLLNKINGVLSFLSKQSGFIKIDGTEKEYWFAFQDVMSNDQQRPLVPGHRVRFCPVEYNGEPVAVAVEVL